MLVFVCSKTFTETTNRLLKRRVSPHKTSMNAMALQGHFRPIDDVCDVCFLSDRYRFAEARQQTKRVQS
jgi:hypothetical protein